MFLERLANELCEWASSGTLAPLVRQLLLRQLLLAVKKQ